MSKPRRLKFRPVRRPFKWDFNFDVGARPSFSALNLRFNYPPTLLPPTAPPRPITAADVARLSEALKPIGAAMRSMASALRVASLLPPGYLERLRVAMDKEAQEEKVRQAAWLDEAHELSEKHYLELRIGSVLVARPDPCILIPGAFY